MHVKKLWFCISVALVVGAALSAVSCGGGAPAPAQQAAPANARHVDESTAGAVTGRVTFEGPRSRMRR